MLKKKKEYAVHTPSVGFRGHMTSDQHSVIK